MRHSRVRLALVFGLGVLLLFLPAVSADSNSSLPLGPDMLPLWEPSWSPLLLPLSPSAFGVQRDRVAGFAIADLDGDGREEVLVGDDQINRLIVAADGSSSVWDRVWLGSVEEPKPLRSAWIGVGDVDGDDILEVLYVAYPNELYIARRTDPYFLTYELVSEEPIVLESAFTKVCLLDHDSDGCADIIGFDPWSESPSAFVMYGQETGGVGEALPFVGLEDSVTAATLGSLQGTPGTWFLCRESLWFVEQGGSEPKRLHDVGGYEFVVEDVDRDSEEEIIVNHGDSLSIWHAHATGIVILEEIELPYTAQDLGIGDFDGDGFGDLCIRQEMGFEYMLLLQRDRHYGDTLIRKGIPVIEPMMAVSHCLAVGDFDGDGVDDIAHSVLQNQVGVALAHPATGGSALQPIPGSLLLGTDGSDLLCSTPSGGVALMRNNGLGVFQSAPLVDAPELRTGTVRWAPYSACFADVTDAVGEELVVLGYTSRGGIVGVWETVNGEWVQGFFCSLDGEVRPVLVTADIDKDGAKEIVVGVGDRLAICEDARETATAWRSSGIVRWIDWGGPVGPMTAVPSEGREDVVGLMVSEDELALQRLRGHRISKLAVLPPSAPLDLCSDDVNGDGVQDLILAGLHVVVEQDEAWLSLAVGYWLADGRGWYHGRLVSIPGLPMETLIYPYGGMTSGDFDGDGATDIALMSLGKAMGRGEGRGLMILSFDGATFFSQFVAARLTGTRLFALDSDGDGRDDVVHATSGMPIWLSVTRIPEED